MMSSKPPTSYNRRGGGGAGISRSKEQHTGSVSDRCNWPISLEEAELSQKAAELKL